MSLCIPEAVALKLGGHSRRDFLRAIAGAAGTAMALRSGLWAHAQTSSKVAIAHHSKVVTPDGDRDMAALGAMVDKSMAAITGKADPVEAWRSLFEPADVVGLKVNCLGGFGLSTNVALVGVLTQRLQDAGVPASNIIVWERSDRELIQGGFEINADGPGVRCFGTNGQLTAEMSQGQWKGEVSQILADQITALINVPILKDHNLSGIALSLKNHYGSFARPSDFHADGCDPFIADLNTLPLIRQKQRLVVCDATVGCYEGGPTMNPQFLFEPGAILVGTDPVALDYQGWQMIEAARRENDLPPLEALGRHPKQLDSAAQRGLGANDPAAMEVARLELG